MWGARLRPPHSTGTGLGLARVTHAYPQAPCLALYWLPRHTGVHTGVRKTSEKDFAIGLLILCFVDSPGLYCPTGWTTAGELGPSWNGLQMTGSTSGAICCPS